MLSAGKASKEIASHYGVSVRPIDPHRIHLMHKQRLCCVADLVRFAIANSIAKA